jgi:hypothetical protein
MNDIKELGASLGIWIGIAFLVFWVITVWNHFRAVANRKPGVSLFHAMHWLTFWAPGHTDELSAMFNETGMQCIKRELWATRYLLITAALVSVLAILCGD